MRAALDVLLDERGKELKDIPGGASGLLCRDYKGKNRSSVSLDFTLVKIGGLCRGHKDGKRADQIVRMPMMVRTVLRICSDGIPRSPSGVLPAKARFTAVIGKRAVFAAVHFGRPEHLYEGGDFSLL